MKCENCNRAWSSHCQNCSCCYPEGDLHREDCPTLQRRLRKRERERNA